MLCVRRREAEQCCVRDVLYVIKSDTDQRCVRDVVCHKKRYGAALCQKDALCARRRESEQCCVSEENSRGNVVCQYDLSRINSESTIIQGEQGLSQEHQNLAVNHSSHSIYPVTKFDS